MTVGNLVKHLRHCNSTDEVADVLDANLFGEFSERWDEQHADTGIRQYKKLKQDVRGIIAALVLEGAS